jgi:WD40 repeat protein
LFNGKDLDGWRRHAGQPARWQARDGEIVVTGATSHLYTIRDDFADFSLRLEALLEPGDDAAVFLRSSFGPSPGEGNWFPAGYAVRLGDDPAKDGLLSGSLLHLRPARERLGKAGDWFRLEVIARGPRIQTRINGQTVVDYEDRDRRFRRGHIALQKIGRGSRVRFRKIEVREEGEPPPEPPPPAAVSPVPRTLFEAKANTPLVAKAEVKSEAEGWRFEQAGPAPSPVPLFEVEKPDFETGQLTCRFQLRGEKVEPATLGLLGGSMVRHAFGLIREKPGSCIVSLVFCYPGRPEVTVARSQVTVKTSWEWQEIGVFTAVSGQKPERVRIEVQPSPTFPVWLRDLRLEQTNLEPMKQSVEVIRPRPVELNVEPITILAGHTGGGTSLAVAPDARTLVSGGREGQLIFWSLVEGRWQKRQACQAGGGLVAATSFAPDGSAVAAACHDGQIRLWRRQSGEWAEATIIGKLPGPGNCLAWAPDSGRLAAGASGTTPPGSARVHVFDVRQGKELFTLGSGKIRGVVGVIFTPDGKRLGAGWARTGGSPIEWFDLGSRKVVDSSTQGVPVTWATHFRPDSKQVSATASGKSVGIWREEGDNWPGMWFSEHTGNVRALAFSANGDLLASGGQDRTVKIRDVASGLELVTLRGHQADTFRLAFSADGQLLATASVDSTIQLWKIGRPATPGPFVILARADRPERAHTSLAAATAGATAGDVIEVRGNGPFLTSPVLIRNKALTIRAGVGWWPVIALDPRRTQASLSLISSNANLTIEGLELHQALKSPAAGSKRIVHSEGALLRLAHCRLISRGDAEGILCEQPAGCELKGCIIWPENGPAVAWNRPQSARLLLEGCLVGGHGLFVRDTSAASPIRDVTLRLSHTTLVGPRGLELRVGEPLGKLPTTPPKPGLDVELADSILDASEHLVVFRAMKDPALSAGDAKAWLAQRLRWHDRRCLLGLAGMPRGVVLVRPNQPTTPLGEAGNLDVWDRLWGQKNTGSRKGRPNYPDGGDLRFGGLFDFLPADLLGLDASGIGAAPDRLGPGSAYWRWRQSPEHKRWAKQGAAKP